MQQFGNISLLLTLFSIDVANALFSRLGLHIPDVQYKEICAKMCIRQSTHKDRGTTGTSWQRYERIYQCGCGTDHTEGGKHPKRNRQIAWPDLGCPCWIRLITMQGKTNTDTIVAILGISGVLTHSDACISKTDLENKPRFPLHPDVRNYALSLLRERAPISMVRAQCKKFAEARWGAAMGNIEFRYRLATHDSSSLYRSAAAEIGVPQRSKPEENLYAWFGPTPTPPTPEFTKSCLHYQPHISASENAPEQRFELVLATPQMQKAAWTYGHKKLVHMDLTFGVCSARTLLAILMTSNPRGKGIPIAFIMFTARKSAKAVHADYDTAILTRLLEKFKQGMGVNELLEVFDIGVGVVDLDPREHSSLRTNWDLIFLLWCIFHVWQAWRNALNKYLLSIPKGDARQEVRKRLVGLLIPLMRDVIVYDEACRLYNDEITYFTAQVSKQRSVISRKQGTAGLSFLAYFKRYVKSYADWLPWSPAGPIKAAEILGVAPSDVPRTNNPLESFNGHIKGTYFLPYLHSGRLPRVDVWILLIITKVMPTFFADIDDKAAMMDY
ncbi:hypothetical protein BDZ89DRAFT_961037 [Hymenopellis radicata]|nr:hypothetical protein BDZ89DRAFT_961037 [Hymenopellis radicata]